jgi:hypothetical protein
MQPACERLLLAGGWCEANHIRAVNCLTRPLPFSLYHQCERSNAEMNWWKRLWEQLWETLSGQPAAVNEWTSVLPHWSAVPEEWVVASVIRG